jgi:hypothetical protein
MHPTIFRLGGEASEPHRNPGWTPTMKNVETTTRKPILLFLLFGLFLLR